MRNKSKQAMNIFTSLFFLSLVLIWGTGMIARVRIAHKYPAPGRLVDVGTLKMHIYCTGAGSPTVILSSGSDDFSILWSKVQPEVSKVTRVCSYDRAGLGRSEASHETRTAAVIVRELHLLLSNVGMDPPYLFVGHSFGGALTRLYAYQHPEEVAGLVLVDAAPDELFLQVPKWRNAMDRKIKFYKLLAPLSSLGLLALSPNSIPNRGMSEEVLARYRAIAVSTNYFQTGITENSIFERNLSDIHTAKIDLGDLPLIVISRGYWDPMPGFSEEENQLAWQAWQTMQSEFLPLSSDSRQIVATASEHTIQLQQPELVIGAIDEILDKLLQQGVSNVPNP